MCYQFHRTRDRVRRVFRQSLAYEHALHTLELIEAHADDWFHDSWQEGHLFEPVIPNPPPQPSAPPAATAPPGFVALGVGFLVVDEAEVGCQPLSDITSPSESAENSIPNAQPEPEGDAFPRSDVPVLPQLEVGDFPHRVNLALRAFSHERLAARRVTQSLSNHLFQ